MAKEENIYRRCREDAGLSRERAGALLEWISPDRIDRIERGALPRPDEVLRMAECYHRPELCNHYCTHSCEIGQKLVPEVQEKNLANIVLELLSTLNSLDREKNRLIDITADGEISPDEYADFAAIRRQLEQISAAVDSLKLWIQKTAPGGALPEE